MDEMPKVINLGWANGWKETPEIVKKCHALGHRPIDIDRGPPFRGLDHEVRCDICGYVYHVDSSD